MKSKKEKATIVPKGWGHEVIFVNNDKYCGKLLNFTAGKKFSMHYHILKDETWYVAKGSFNLYWIDTEKGETVCEKLTVGEIIRNFPGQPHQLEALEDSTVFEVSTQHFDYDSHRITLGDVL
jgi:quercetin dioxygenase-like cupin family protein